MNFHFVQNSNSLTPNAYNPKILEGNWYEDRCTEAYDKSKKKEILLPSANSWQYDTTYNDLGQTHKNFSINRFSQSSDNYINFQGKDYKMYVTTYKHSMDPQYKETFRKPTNTKDFFKGKDKELEEYRKTWTKREQIFETTYSADILDKTK